MKHEKRAARTAALVTAMSLVLQPVVPLIGGERQTPTRPPVPAPAQTPSKPAPAPAKPAATTAAAPLPVDGGWPRMYSLPSGGTILVYQPQIATWDNQTNLVAFSAVSYRPKSGDKPSMGTVKLEAATKVSVPDRLVSFQQMKIAEANFQGLPKEQLQEVTAEIDRAIPDDERVIALDRVLANLDKSVVVPRNVEGIKADPPPIFFSKTPAAIVNLDGEPIWSPIKDNDLQFAVNTNWDLFQHGPTSTFYLRNNDTWLKAADVKGPWAPAGALPGSFSKLPAEENWKDVKANLPGKAIAAKAVPKIFVTFQPGELILLTGEPTYAPVTGTSLMWISNTESDLFRVAKTGQVYYLVTGRWFSAPDFAGPWTFATPSLPEDFKKSHSSTAGRVY